MTEPKLKNNFPSNGKHWFAVFGLLAITLMIALSGVSFKSDEEVNADNPTFFFSASSSCSSSTGLLTKPTGSTTLYLCVDGDNEGAGLLGSELNITYETDYAQVTGISCSAFDTCIDLSEEGTMKLLAASGPADEGGNPVKTQQKLANVSVNLLKEGRTTLSFTVSQVIDENEEVKVRNATPLVITISGEAEEEEVTEEVPTEEETPPLENCNNGIVDSGAGEQCDPAAASSLWLYESCTDAGFSGGSLSCAGTCKLNYTACEGVCSTCVCGNGIIEPREECDDANFLDDDGCSSVCTLEEVAETETEPPVIPESKTEGASLSSVSVRTQYPADSLAQGASIQIFAFANYSNGDSQSVTSCFPCPTSGSDTRNGSVVYHASGPGYFAGNYLYANRDAKVGDTITFSAIYTDNISKISKTSSSESVTVTVARAPEEEKTVPPETKPVEEETKDTGEGATTAPIATEGEGAMRGAAPALAPSAVVSQATGVITQQTVQGSVEFKMPTNPADDLCVQNYSNETDTDGDGLTDRTECYIKTDPAKADSDNDSCWDGDEINQFYTSPLNADDCSSQAKITQTVIITDPQPGWIVKEVEISGIAPKTSNAVAAVAFRSEYKPLKALIDALQTLSENKNEPSIAPAEKALSELETFTNNYSAYEYDELADAVKTLKPKVEYIKQKKTAEEIKKATDEMYFPRSIEYLGSKLIDPVYLGSTNELSEAAIGSDTAKRFHITTDQKLEDNKLYDVVAIASTDDGKTISSAPVRFSVDSTLNINKPMPRSIGGEAIPYGSVALNGILINGVLASDGDTVEVQVKDQKPVISGDTEYGSQVFAIWESIVLASSVISDSEQGAFAVQAPRDLEDNTAHKVTLYAVKTDETGQPIRSENVDVFFRVKTQVFPWGFVLGGAGIALILVLGTVAIRRRMRSKAVAAATIQETMKEAEKAYEEVKTVAYTPAPVQTPANIPVHHVETAKKPIFQALEQAPVTTPPPAIVQPTTAPKPVSKEEALKENIIHTDEEILHEAEKELQYAMHKLDSAIHKLDEDRHI